MKYLAMAVAATLALGATPAMAYVGPGAGLSLLGAFWGLVVAVLAALSFVILYPIRRLMRGRRRPADGLEPVTGAEPQAASGLDPVAERQAAKR